MKLYGLSGQQWTAVIASWSGWLMDGYVTIAYALAAVTISHVFFAGLKSYGLIAAVLGLAVGSIARSIGSLIFGNYLGDRIGRRNMLVVTVTGFSIFSFAIGFLPTYSSVGYLAPALLYLLLFFVGLFAGAEYGGGTALYSETVPAEKRGVIGAFVQSGFGTGFFIVAGVWTLIGTYYTTIQIESFAWRILFITTLIPGVIAIVSRFGAKESPVFQEMEKKMEIERVPIWKMLTEAPLPVILAICVTTGLLYINSGTFSFYAILMSSVNGIGNADIGTILIVANLISLLGVWIGGFISTLIPGRRLAMMIYASIFIVSLYPLTRLGVTSSVDTLYVVYSVQAFLEAMIFSTLPSFLAEKFSKRYRSTAVGFTYNAGAIVGGFAPTFILLFRASAGIVNSWFLNLAIANVLLIIGLVFSAETWFKTKGAAKDVIMD